MANSIRGEVALEIGGTSLTLVLTTNALCEVQTLLKIKMHEILGTLQRGEYDPEYMRALFWGALRKHHRGFTLEKAGELFDEAGMTKASAAIVEAMTLAFPAADGAGESENPPKAE